ncbi:NADH-quinone oxidoreductase subunit J [Singulisphaera sp. Ch08]|uniref:NADH-quinone oxidoreductase subunit J n=1 Tax=Singulisphaera sp. Ch08 TaxID=3120278 RepID=A0AAU7CQV6_9BACT
MSQTLFLVISALGLVAAVGTILARNLVHAALYLVAFFFIVACQFVLLEAEFLAAIQVLVYIGAVAILLMFGIMLTRNIQGDDTTTVAPGWTMPALVAGLGLFLVLGFGIKNQVGVKDRADWAATVNRPSIVTREGETPSPRAFAINNMGLAVGYEMMTRFVVPFEVAGLLLTAALVGAIALAHREGEDEPTRLGAQATALHGATEPSSSNVQASLDGSRSEPLSSPSK